MQATRKHTRVSRKAGKNLSNGKVALRNTLRSKGTGEESSPTLSCHTNDYLKETFRSVPASELDPLFSEDNYRYLYDCAKNYASLLEQGFEVEYAPSAFRDLYEKFERIIPGRYNLTLIDKDGKIHFRIDESCHSQTLFYIPCEILDMTNGQFREILLQFFRILKFVHNLTAQRNSYHCEGLFQELEYQEELIAEGQESDVEDMDSDYVQLLKSYRDGDIGKTLDQVDEHPAYAPGELVDIIEKYTPANASEKKLLSLIHDGLNDHFLSEEPIFIYVGTPDFDSAGGNTPMRADELMMIIYADDWICNNMIESVNCECENGESEYFCSGSIELTPDMDSLMEKNTFVEPFLDWILELFNVLNEFKPNGK